MALLSPLTLPMPLTTRYLFRSIRSLLVLLLHHLQPLQF